MTDPDQTHDLCQSNADVEQSSQDLTDNPAPNAPKVTRLPPPTLASVADPGRIRFGAGFRIKPPV